MKSQPSIPQHSLQNQGSPLSGFEYIGWGGKALQKDVTQPHRHNFYELIVFDKGEGTHDIDFTSHIIKPRSVHFIRPDDVHLLLRSADTKGCSLHFTGEYITDNLAGRLPFGSAKPVIQLAAKDFAVVQKLIGLIAAEYVSRSTGYESIIRSHLQSLMLYLARACEAQQPATVVKAARPELVEQFARLVEQLYAKHYTIEQYAQELNVSAKHLITLCKTHTGKTPLQFVAQYTIVEAKRLLYHTQLSIKEIAWKLGFEEPANFSKYFKNATGYTPLAYREGSR